MDLCGAYVVADLREDSGADCPADGSFGRRFQTDVKVCRDARVKLEVRVAPAAIRGLLDYILDYDLDLPHAVGSQQGPTPRKQPGGLVLAFANLARVAVRPHEE